MKLITVRHAKSVMNRSNLVQGRFDCSLSKDIGVKQAKQVAKRLKDKQIDFAYVSPLQRAKQTAEIILKFHPATKVIYDNQLAERSLGNYEGGPRSQYYQDMEKSSEAYVDFKPKGGETWYEAGERFTKFYQKNILPQHQNTNDTVLIVAHGTVLMYFLLWLDGKFKKPIKPMSYQDTYHPNNTAVSVIEIDKHGHGHILTLNDTSHLEK